ncbi:nucleolar complex protein 14 [Sporothrix bragantina]|uniref:Nucleolar complex protein 14 n=1 Tax=Sporothrix bragantina TaxID=671064 RepID=A0ABP0ARK8_9PEZI
MAGSQLKRLKASLLDQGIIGPQKSKKQKKQAAEEARANQAAGRGYGTTNNGDKRLKKSAALETIREQFNPFQFKMNARGPKFPVTSLKNAQVPESLRGIKGRPTVSLSRAEEKRRSTLLLDMQRRNKVGGILDRRLGEGDPNMTPEERALERFTFEKQRIHNKKGAVFDLEDDEAGFLGGADDGGLTHMGKSLSLGDFGKRRRGGDDDEDDDGDMRDDFDEEDLQGSDDDDTELGRKKQQLKRMREELFGEKGEGAGAEGEGEDGAPERKKSKKEVMEEVIAKSKYYKYERQVTRENDDDVRAELDKMLPELQQLLSTKPVKAASQNGVAPIIGAPFDKDAFDKTYDVRLRQLIQDKKAEPSTRTKTEEEVAAEQSAHLKKLEESRVRRMMGQIGYDDGGNGSEDDSEDGGKGGKKDKKKADKENAASKDGPAVQILRGDDYEEDEFDLGKGIKVKHTAAELGFDDEDDFLIDDDLVFSGSEIDVDESDEDDDESGDEDEDGNASEASEDDEFIRGILTEDEKKNAVFANAGKLPSTAPKGNDDDGVPFTFPCPQTHAELLAVLENIPVAKLPTVVQRIRALYHPKLDHGNKDRLGRFAAALVEHIAYLADGEEPPYATIESLARHIHSLAKTVPIEVAVAFRAHLAAMEGISIGDAPKKASNSSRALAFNSGDLAILTAAGSVFPTSDHFHQVITPAMLSMARYLEQAPPRSLSDYATGLYVCTLMCQYQRLSKRYVPELVNYMLSTLLALAPTGSDVLSNPATGYFPVHSPAQGIRIEKAQSLKTLRKLRVSDCRPSKDDASKNNELKLALFNTALTLLADAATSLWAGKASLYETLEPCRAVLQHLRTNKTCRSQLPAVVNKEVDRLATQIDATQRAAHLARRPLELHHHRPLAIRTFVPRFEDEFDPDKHYDPNRERAEAAKLKAEFKRERKGALRELRKDAHFMQREKLKMKKAKDAAYEKKYKRLVAEIQGSEGREANAYERERAARKRK